MSRSNCLFFAVALYWRRLMAGRSRGILIRATRLGLGPHFLFATLRRSGQYRVVSYVPIDQTPKALPPIVFDGSVKWGDL